jgi:hypothetical protein
MSHDKSTDLNYNLKLTKCITLGEYREMKKEKISLYLDPSQLKLINEIASKLQQKRALILRESINYYLSLYRRSKKENLK